MHEMERIEAAVSFLREQGVQDARLCLVLGSGMRSFGERLTGRVEIPFGRVGGISPFFRCSDRA